MRDEYGLLLYPLTAEQRLQRRDDLAAREFMVFESLAWDRFVRFMRGNPEQEPITVTDWEAKCRMDRNRSNKLRRESQAVRKAMTPEEIQQANVAYIAQKRPRIREYNSCSGVRVRRNAQNRQREARQRIGTLPGVMVH